MTHPNAQTERANLKAFIKRKLPGMRAVVAAPNTGKGADRSVVLIHGEHGWFQAVKCWHGNHLERARAIVAEYNAANPASNPHQSPDRSMENRD